jgi:hypothetical protein
MKRRQYMGTTIAFGIFLCAVVYVFLGIEVHYREHHTDYTFFAKQTPGVRVMYTNPVQCGECDVKPLERLDEEQRAEFALFCRVRFGLDEIRQCHAIYAEAQRIAREHWPVNKP